MSIDDMIHGSFARTRVRRIDEDTPIIPRAIAEAVCEEVGVWLQQPLPRSWVRELVAHANTVYACNAQFRRKLRSRGDAGRDWLWAFMRHWLAALLSERHPQWFAQLPPAFVAGGELPASASGVGPQAPKLGAAYHEVGRQLCSGTARRNRKQKRATSEVARASRPCVPALG